MSRVVLLNGASSAGKTSIGKELQNRLSWPYLLLGLDTCFGTVPEPWGSTGRYRGEGFTYVELPAEDGGPVLGIEYGEVGWQMMRGFHLAVATMVGCGNRVIIDEMFLDSRVRDHWRRVLAPFRPVMVGAYCSLAELERRERGRSPRTAGLSRWSHRQVHRGVSYDLTVDTTDSPPGQAAAPIASHIHVQRESGI